MKTKQEYKEGTKEYSIWLNGWEARQKHDVLLGGIFYSPQQTVNENLLIMRYTSAIRNDNQY